MPTLQVRDLPEDIYRKLSYLAEKEHRSLAQEAIVLLKEGLENKLSNKGRRKRILDEFAGLGIDTRNLPDPAELIREDRDNR
ncbi:MAG: hypothetical protein J0L62_14890 [Bacteroidetes bacterium]|nr:hypothetical protein [Bacteroidota bacterium]